MSESTSPDPLALYVASVQDSARQVRVLERLYARLRPGRRASILREDFAGAASESIAWVARGPRRQAIAVEREAATLAWAQARATSALSPKAAARLQFVRGDVRRVRVPSTTPAPDLICALNFSIFYLHEQSDLRAYFRRARRALAPGGMLVLNAFGGPGAVQPHRETYPIAPGVPGLPARFDYHWEVAAFDHLRMCGDYRIHFSWRGRKGRVWVRDAFRYDWRIWSLPELTEALREAGFSDAIVWRHTYDAATQQVFFGPAETLPERGTWTVYVLGLA